MMMIGIQRAYYYPLQKGKGLNVEKKIGSASRVYVSVRTIFEKESSSFPIALTSLLKYAKSVQTVYLNQRGRAASAPDERTRILVIPSPTGGSCRT